ncbi:hypothetical protein [Paractinoplanes atraurantiacus]|uniref:Uncharacterized protein n=1 Tax=Paractinoplanes atraurantiacus TaxID=1036182 RepID=A0A285HX53_9ACTN|nr:hypothetical protein [Actinoplanes atraurantiacus]SNY40285.1 hypothetical protein SAMN05421748_10616 [Actinoplanes atraurantiacus]
MSYDLTFLNKAAEQSWEEAAEAAEQEETSGDRPGDGMWSAVLASAREVLIG